MKYLSNAGFPGNGSGERRLGIQRWTESMTIPGQNLNITNLEQSKGFAKAHDIKKHKTMPVNYAANFQSSF